MNSKFKVGDKVKIIRKPTKRELENWSNSWTKEMDKFIGKTTEITGIIYQDQYSVKCTWQTFPSCVFKLTDEENIGTVNSGASDKYLKLINPLFQTSYTSWYQQVQEAEYHSSSKRLEVGDEVKIKDYNENFGGKVPKEYEPLLLSEKNASRNTNLIRCKEQIYTEDTTIFLEVDLINNTKVEIPRLELLK